MPKYDIPVEIWIKYFILFKMSQSLFGDDFNPEDRLNYDF